MQAYEWPAMVRDQSMVMRHNVAMLVRRGPGAIGLHQSPPASLARFDARTGAASLAKLDTTKAVGPGR